MLYFNTVILQLVVVLYLVSLFIWCCIIFKKKHTLKVGPDADPDPDPKKTKPKAAYLDPTIKLCRFNTVL